ncbi:MAG TPA: hypothetical protein PLR90_04705 [Methylophilus sp.]|nr:hypothetical protein [Methylophilus sp.]
MMKVASRQAGLALLIFIFIIAFIATGYFLSSLDPVEARNERNKKTAEALMEAKTALLAYAASQNLSPGTCTTNCPRPGDLPCPDMNNDGDAENACGSSGGTTGQALRLGRLPWRTLGLSDLRDGDGERLWYAVSSRYKNNSRYRPLNSETVATITLRDSSGNVLFNGVNNGLAAVLIAPGPVLVREDGISQLRDVANQNVVSNYLDKALGEDNQNFIDSNVNGFITGPIKDINGTVIVNDQILTITRDEMNQSIEKRVIAEVKNALVSFYYGPGVSTYPRPANFIDTTCLGNSTIISPNCGESGALTQGRIPANPATPWGATSILRGTSSNNWFQLNSWREVIYYAVSPLCVTGTVSCPAGGDLTLNNALVAPTNNKQFIIIAAGKRIGTQVRSTSVDKSNENNYLEGENLSPLDDVYTRAMPLTTTFNDQVISVP